MQPTKSPSVKLSAGVACWWSRNGKPNKDKPTVWPRYCVNSCPKRKAIPGAKLFLIGRGKENPAQFLFYELFRDEAALKAHQDSAYFKTYIAGQALPLLAKRERTQYALL
jgi:Antibiotic biosynthesis monooxygenase